MPNKDLFTVNELADYLKMRPITIYKHAAAGKLPGFKVGSKWRFKKSTIDRWIEEQENSRIKNEHKTKNTSTPEDLKTLDTKILDNEFVKLTKDIKLYLESIKDEFDQYDKRSGDENAQIKYVELKKDKIFRKFDKHFAEIWEIVKSLDGDAYVTHQNFYYNMLSPLLGKDIEINDHIYRKPFGYDGDFIIMLYMYTYNYHNKKYLGQTSYQKLINNYTCSILFSLSNVQRKEFFKKRILDTINKYEVPNIISVGSGPARELIELLQENKINKKFHFTCLDFEQKALNYIKEQIESLDSNKKRFLNISYIHKNITDIAKAKVENEFNNTFNLIYVAGVFDYLKGRISARLSKRLFELLKKDGTLIICNASAENISNRAYYEFLGKWYMFHRTKDDLLSWTSGFDDKAIINFDGPSEPANYLYLNIKKVQ